ncbi:MAG TPA: hypothetical protein VHC90_02595 [Bryobacteraceae bacterium]|nr:hypothetical protein [Bryobacteraceae bacterium]
MHGLSRIAALTALAASLAPAWTMSVEFPYTSLPRGIWEQHLAHLKEMGVTHVSLPPAQNVAELDAVIPMVRQLGLEADLEGPIPQRLETLAKSHGGPLTDPPAGAVRVAATMPRAIENERKLLLAGTRAIVWTGVFEILSPAYQPGAIHLSGSEGPAAAIIRREAQMAHFWGLRLAALPEVPGARLSTPAEGITVHQFIAEKSGATAPADTPHDGLSLVSLSNNTPNAWQGDVRVMYPALDRVVEMPSVSMSPHDVLWLPVDIPLAAGPLCSGCNGFAPPDHLAFATAELTAMEYENGVLAMEFIAPKPGQVILQLSHEPTGPLLAGGHPTVFDWDTGNHRARLPIPAGDPKTGRVRIALAIDAPQATGFFEGAPVLLIGETNSLTAEFSPAAVAARSRVRISPDLPIAQEPPAADADKEKPVIVTYKITVPPNAIEGDTAQLAIEADGVQLSHSRTQLRAPAAVTIEDSVAVRVAADSFVAVRPATIPVNQRSGRELVVTLSNNAPEIREFQIAFDVPGLEFSPAKMNIVIGASLAREVTFRVFGQIASTGVHSGEVRISGAATMHEPVRFVVLPAAGAIAWSADEFSFLESTKARASFLKDRWMEMIDKDSGKDAQPAGGTAFTGGPVASLRLEDLQKAAPAKRSPQVSRPAAGQQ